MNAHSIPSTDDANNDIDMDECALSECSETSSVASSMDKKFSTSKLVQPLFSDCVSNIRAYEDMYVAGQIVNYPFFIRRLVVYKARHFDI